MNEPLGIFSSLQEKRASLTANLSPMARHRAFPGIYAMPAPVPADAPHEPEPEPEPEPDLAELVRAAVEKYMGSISGKKTLERAVTSALTEEASRWRKERLSKAEIAAAVVANPIDRVLAVAADITGITVEVMRKPDRRRYVAWRRHFAIALLHCARRDLSTSQIGRVFGGQDHTTVLHALNKCIERRLHPECEAWFLDPRAAKIFVDTEYAMGDSAETDRAGAP